MPGSLREKALSAMGSVMSEGCTARVDGDGEGGGLRPAGSCVVGPGGRKVLFLLRGPRAPPLGGRGGERALGAPQDGSVMRFELEERRDPNLKRFPPEDVRVRDWPGAPSSPLLPSSPGAISAALCTSTEN